MKPTSAKQIKYVTGRTILELSDAVNTSIGAGLLLYGNVFNCIAGLCQPMVVPGTLDIHEPTNEAILKCYEESTGKILARSISAKMDIPYRDAIDMCERNGIEPFQICGQAPLKQLSTDIE